MASHKDPLVVAATRPAMKWGVTLDGIIVGFGIASVAMIATNNPFTLLLYFPVHAIMYLLCLRDPRTFRLLSLWMNTKTRSLAWKQWGASTATPFVNTRNKKKAN